MHTMFPNTVNRCDAVGHPRTEIVMCVQYSSVVSLSLPFVVCFKPIFILQASSSFGWRHLTSEDSLVTCASAMGTPVLPG
jgi:hypothetical protein